jgi:hypothetical protein
MLVTVKIFQFHDMLNENRFLGTFLGHGKRPKSIAVHFLRILQWWGKIAHGPIFLALPQG